MGFFIFLIVLMTSLIILTIATTIIKFSLFVTTKYNYETYILIIPAILYVLLWLTLFLLCFIMADNYTAGGIINLLIETLLNSNISLHAYTPTLICIMICCIAGITIQPFIFLTVNIPYNNLRVKLKEIFSKIKKWFITKVLNKELKPELMPINDVAIKQKWVKLKYINALISSIFSFSVIFFTIALLLFASSTISKKILDKIPKHTIMEVEQKSIN